MKTIKKVMIEETLEDFLARKKDSSEKIRAEAVRVNKNYILQKEGKEGFEKVKKRIKELGVEMDFEELDSKTWEEDWKNSILVATAKEVFNWTEEDVFEMGRYGPRSSFFIKMVLQNFVSLDTVLNNASDYWKKHCNLGSLEVVDYNEEKKYVVIRIRDLLMHPVICVGRAGFLKGISEFVLKSSNTTIEETKCMHKGDDYHEYTIRWE